MKDFADATVRVRYAETDQMGVVYHANYFTWFEVGRVELCRHLGFEYKQMESEDDTLNCGRRSFLSLQAPGEIRRHPGRAHARHAFR